MKIKVLMVCLGNICRSPLAEGLLRAKVDPTKVVVDSAGTSNYHEGQAPDPRSVEVAAKNGLDLSTLRARQVKAADFDEFDVVYAMDQSNYNDLLKIADTEEKRKKLKLILNELHPEKDLEVPDPYFGGEDGFDKVYDMLDNATAIIAKELY